MTDGRGGTLVLPLTVTVPRFSARAAHLACHGARRYALPGSRGNQSPRSVQAKSHTHVEGQTHYRNRQYIKAERTEIERGSKRGGLGSGYRLGAHSLTEA